MRETGRRTVGLLRDALDEVDGRARDLETVVRAGEVLHELGVGGGDLLPPVW